MSPFSLDPDCKRIERCHHRPAAGRETSHRNAGPVVHSVYLADLKSPHKTIIEHSLRAALASFFCRLEDKNYVGRELPGASQVFRRPKQHRLMAIVSAGVHPPASTRLIR